jgi:maltose O-acetyltransferase
MGKRSARLARTAINCLVGASVVPQRARRVLLRAYGVDIHTSGIMERCFFGGNDIHIGRETTISLGCVFDNSAHIAIGDRVRLGMHVMFVTSTHEIGPATWRAGAVIARPISVGNGCWLGSNVTVLPGVTIGEGCVIGAGALVTRDAEPNGVYAGIPARRIRAL